MNALLKNWISIVVVGGLALTVFFLVIWHAIHSEILDTTDMMLLTFILTIAAAATGVRLNGTLGEAQEMHRDAEAVRATQIVQHASDAASSVLTTATQAASTVLSNAAEAAKVGPPPVPPTPPPQE